MEIETNIRLSVVIPCRNEKPFIKECIEAIYNCHLPVNTELSVFIIDGMSNDGTREEIKNLMNTYPDLYLVDNVRQLTPFAFNLGIVAAGETDYIQIVGARHILSTNYLNKCIEILRSDSDIWCVGGKIINEYINETGRIISLAMSTTFGMGLGNFRTLNESGFTDTVTSPMYPFEVFEKIGFFDEELIRNQDDDFNFRVTNAGGKIWYENSINLKYYVRGDYKGLWRQFYQYGYWKVYVNKKHKSVTTLRQVVPPLFVLYVICWLLSTLVGLNFFAVSSLPMVIYFGMGVYFALLVSENKNWFQVFKTFPVLHFGYGLGYLKGIWEFLILNKKPSDKQKRLSR